MQEALRHPLPAGQLAQVIPPLPQALSRLPSSQVACGPTQPGQPGSMQVPAVQTWLPMQATQAAPPAPQALG